MRIGIVSPLDEKVPPSGYGGTELIVSLLTEELVKRNHEVTLFASGDSVTKAKLIAGSPKSLRSMNYSLNPVATHLLMIDKVVSMSDSFDIIHSHVGWRFLPFVKYCRSAVVNTYHAPYDHARIQFFLEKFSSLNYTSLSESHRAGVKLNFLATVYNAIDLGPYSPDYSPTNKEEIIFISKLSPTKGAHIALKLATELNKKILLVGLVQKDNLPLYQYYLDQIQPFLSKPLVTNIGETTIENKVGLLRRSRFFLFPVSWEEQFGLVMIEAMACGTPVIAYARGSVPEVLEDGKTGFIVNPSEEDKRGDFIIKKTGVDGLKEAVELIYNMADEQYRIMRQNCRKHVESRFTVKNMVNGYEDVYRRAIEAKLKP